MIKSCDHKSTKDILKTFDDGEEYLRRECLYCDTFIRFLNKENNKIENEIIHFGEFKGSLYINLELDYLELLSKIFYKNIVISDKINKAIFYKKNISNK